MRKSVVLDSVTSDGHFSGMIGDLDWTDKNSKDDEWNRFVADNAVA